MKPRTVALLVGALTLSGCSANNTAPTASPTPTAELTCQTYRELPSNDRAKALGMLRKDMAGNELEQAAGHAFAYCKDHLLTSFADVAGFDGVLRPAAETVPAVKAWGDQARLVMYQITSSEGWTYAGSFNIPNPIAFATKDISSSPPGKAKVVVTTSQVNVPSPVPITPNNPGRPNGPTLTPTYYAAIEYPHALTSGEGGYPIGFGKQCAMAGNGTYDFEPFQSEAACSLFSSGETSGASRWEEGREDVADQLIAAINGSPQATIVLSFGKLAMCNIYIRPDNSVTYYSRYQEECPSAQTTTLHVTNQ